MIGDDDSPPAELPPLGWFLFAFLFVFAVVSAFFGGCHQ